MSGGEGVGLPNPAAQACTAAALRLRDAGVPPEALAEFVPEGRRLRVLRRPATMLPLGEVWRLGSLLLSAELPIANSLGADAEEPQLYAAGRATRAAERGRPGYQDLSREDRRDLAAAALRGGYAVGVAVNFDATPLPLDAAALLALGSKSPIGVYDGEVRVRWRSDTSLESAQTLERYLEERVGLLVDPPLTST